MVTLQISPGDAVLTKYGTGVVLRCCNALENAKDTTSSTSPNEWATIRLWRQPGKSIATGAVATMRIEYVLSKIVAAPGMVVRAAAGQTTACDATSDNGDEAVAGKKTFLVERYLPDEDTFLVSSTSDDEEKENEHLSLAKSLAVMSSSDTTNITGTENNMDEKTTKLHSTKKHYQYLSPNQIDASSSSAKFYPILDDLIQRGEKAWSQSFSTQDVKDAVQKTFSDAVVVTPSPSKKNRANKNGEGDSNTSTAKLISDTAKTSLETLGNGTLNNDMANTTVSDAISKISDKAAFVSSEAVGELSLPQAEEIKQIYEMLRDENLTALFEKSKARLNELVEKEIPERTKKALGAIGVELKEDNGESSVMRNGQTIRGSISKLRKDALSSLEQILKISVDKETGEYLIQTNGTSDPASVQINTQHILNSTSSAKEMLSSPSVLQAQKQFSEMYDTLSSVATSDPELMQLFSSISDKTKSWQEMTGRLLQTKTASLFMEGGARLRSRAAELLKIAPGQFRGSVGSGSSGSSEGEYTRAFTEGDVAMAKLKSMEMGDAIKKRLFNAIELRSESSGGLDAIIAGSLAAISRKGDSVKSGAKTLVQNSRLDVSLATGVDSASGAISEDGIESIITSLQQSASSALKGSKESLIALLSKRSGYRDAVLLRLEHVFMDMESQLGRDMSAQEIASIARGEGGTLSLFQPVAMRAAKEIESQLDAAEKKMRESKHWDPRADAVMGKVRQITSGELSMMDLLDTAAGYLDDEEVVAKSGGLIVKAETFLDEFEAASAKLGKMSTSATSSVGTGFVEVAAKAGITKDSLMQGVGQLDVNKLLDDTQTAMTDEAARRDLISSAGDTALDFLLRILPSMPVPPFDGVREGLVYHISNLSMAGFKVQKEDIYIEIAGIQAAQHSKGDEPPQSREVKASELLVIDVKNISATLDDAVWSFEQTYMPYLKGRGKANTKLWSGSIRLKFELRRHLIKSTDPDNGEEKETWEPVLCLNDRYCSIGGIELVFQGEGRITWVANKMTNWLKNPLRDYVVGVIVNALTNNSGWLIDHLNQNLSPYWEFVMRTAKLELMNLPILEQHHVIKAEIAQADEVELVWREKVPLGLNILTNDKSGYLKVIDLPRGTQARQVAQQAQLDPDIFKGSTIVSVNGRRYGPDSQVDLFSALKDPSRPKSILFRLVGEGDVTHIDRIIQKQNSKNESSRNSKKQSKNRDDDANIITTINVTDRESIGIKFAASPDGYGLIVSEFLEGSQNNYPGVEPNYFLSHVNNNCVLGDNGEGKEKALRLLESEGALRPLSLSFVKPYLYNITIEKDAQSFGGPSELVFSELKPVGESGSTDNKIALTGYALAEGAAESGKVFVGDNLVFINGIPVGAGCRIKDGRKAKCPPLVVVIDMLKRMSPLALTFARADTEQKAGRSRSSALSLNIDAVRTFSLEAFDYDHIGCTFVVGNNGTDIVVRSISGVEGSFQRHMNATKLPLIGCVLESVDDEIVPSYVNSQLIINAMSRRWVGIGSVKLTFCNQKHKDAVRKLCSFPANCSPFDDVPSNVYGCMN